MIPDYLALWKTRILLNVVSGIHKSFYLPVVTIADIALSLFISACFFGGLAQIFRGEGFEMISGIVNVISADLSDHHGRNEFDGFEIYLGSTLFTSLWTVVILLSAILINAFMKVQRFTTWFFDVEHHPVKVIGIVSAALVMTGGGIWSLLRAIL
jgi:hypothetical protein